MHLCELSAHHVELGSIGDSGPTCTIEVLTDGMTGARDALPAQSNARAAIVAALTRQVVTVVGAVRHGDVARTQPGDHLSHRRARSLGIWSNERVVLMEAEKMYETAARKCCYLATML